MLRQVFVFSLGAMTSGTGLAAVSSATPPTAGCAFLGKSAFAVTVEPGSKGAPTDLLVMIDTNGHDNLLTGSTGRMTRESAPDQERQGKRVKAAAKIILGGTAGVWILVGGVELLTGGFAPLSNDPAQARRDSWNNTLKWGCIGTGICLGAGILHYCLRLDWVK